VAKSVEQRLQELEEYVKEQASWKERYQNLEREFDNRLDEKRHEIAVHAQETVDKKLQEIEKTHVPRAEVEDKVKALEKDAEFGRKLRELLQDLAPVPVTTTILGASPNMPSISVADIDERINQRLKEGPEPIPVVSVDVDQRIKDLVKNEVINRIVTRIKALPDPAKKAAWWLHEKKQATVKALYNYVYDKTEPAGRIPGTFYMNIVNPLQDAGLLINEGGNIRWSLQEKLSSELQDILSDSDLEKVPKYLTSLLL